MIIINDCFCHQWLDRTHKVTIPHHRVHHTGRLTQLCQTQEAHATPRDAVPSPYIDEEQLYYEWISWQGEHVGGPFTEEEVEDVKTVLRYASLGHMH